ncbi:Phosphatidylinositol 4-kinase pik1alpha (PI4-kinase)(PtdIns-4-kinase) [Allomyces javanicus]|nr:Phosphatidylinositol 4-kinase pik1alpha (PI4-kinase)(PtdIns-4-kinase) [Allomyces javanicus]
MAAQAPRSVTAPPAVTTLPVATTPRPSTATSSTTSPDSRFGPAHAGLLRLFRSDFFDEWMAVYYLFKYPDHAGIQQYLCDALRQFPVASVQEYLPQLVHILVTFPSMIHLETMIVELCRVSTHFALLTLWYFQSYLADLEEMPTAPATKTCARVIGTVEDIILAREDDLDHHATAHTDSDDEPVNPKDTKTRLMPRMSTSTSTAADASNSTAPAAAAPSPSPAHRVLGSPASPALAPSSSNVFRGPTVSPSLEDLHKGKAFSFSHFVQRVASLSTGPNGSPGGAASPSSKRSSISSTRSGSAAVTPLDSERQARPDTVDTATTASSRRRGSSASVDSSLCNDPKWLERYYFHSEMQFIAALVGISDRLVQVPREARQSTLTAELTLLNHNLPAPVCIPLWCAATGEIRHHQVVRISPTDAVVLNSADRVPFLLFIEVIEDDEADAAAATVESSNALGVTDPTATPRRLPIRRRSSLSMLKELPPPEAMTAETAVVPHTAALRKAPSTSVLPTARSASVPPPTTDLGVRSSTLPTPLSQPAAAKATLANGMGTISEEEFANRMRTAVILLAQLQDQERQVLAAEHAEAAAATTPAARRRALLKLQKKRTKGSGAARLTEEIRNRILREMMALEEQRLKALQESHALGNDSGDLGLVSTVAPDLVAALSTIQPDVTVPLPLSLDLGADRIDDQITPMRIVPRPASANGAASPTPGTNRRRLSSLPAPIPVDKDDPSGAVVRETWARKRERIRTSSGYGGAKHWNLISMIIKTGADLRQEQLACQLIREMHRVWDRAHLPLWVYPYRVLVTGQAHGIIETVRNTVSIHSLKKAMYARHGESFTLKDYFVREFGAEGSAPFTRAQRAFMVSLAGYSIVSYVLQTKDRHNGNLLLDYTTGHLVHIDFGFMLSNSPGSVAFESAPFKLSQEYIDLLGGIGSPMYTEWRQLMVDGFLALRRHHDRVLGLVEVMERDSPLDCFAYTSLQGGAAPTTSSPAPARTASPAAAAAAATSISSATPTPPPLAPVSPVATALRDRLLLSLSDTQVGDFVDRLIASSLGNVFTRLYDQYQQFAQGVMA